MASDRITKSALGSLDMERTLTDQWTGGWEITPDLPGDCEHLCVTYTYLGANGGGRCVRREVSSNFQDWSTDDLNQIIGTLISLCKNEIQSLYEDKS